MLARVRLIRVAAALAAVAVAAGCGGGDPAPVPSATPATTATATPAPSRTALSGTASVTVSGEESFALELALSGEDSEWDPAAGRFAFVFEDADNNLVSVGGSLFQGTRATSGNLAVSLVFNRGERVIAHTDADGGCRVTVTRTGGGAQGSVRCDDVERGRYAAFVQFRVAAG